MDLIESYREELCLIRKPWTGAGIGLIVLALVALPWLKLDYLLYIATVVFIYAIGVQGQNILIGYTGQISFGQAGFLAIGAYTFGHLSVLGVPLPLGLTAAGMMAGLFGLIVGFPSLRLKGPYLAIATMGFGIAVYQILINSELISGGRMGLTVKKLPALFGLTAPVTFYYFILLLALIFTLISYNLISSYAGRAFIAIRDNDIAAEAMGVNLARYKLLSFAVSSFYTGVQGALYALLMGFLEPNLFTFMESVTLFVAVIVGGLASIGGSIMGAAFVILVPQAFSKMKELVPVIFGVAILLILIFEPLGISGSWLKIRLYFRNWPFR
ncbi:MAG: branched-chain amino acid ABC transporter permease [Deltaproteobacteria bacterium]|nr:MAG: branched-chain amino acid ABC transporter permease [Deltaproteobacteria bacterium]